MYVIGICFQQGFLFQDELFLTTTLVFILVPIIIGLIYFAILLFRDSRISESREKKMNQNFPPDESTFIGKPTSLFFTSSHLRIDENALQLERDRLAAPSNNDTIKALNVQKIYSNGLKALDNLTFGAQKGHVFCLLGPNGAGKSTAFETLTGKIQRTSGDIQLNGKSLSSKYSFTELFEQAGMCLQTNTLWDIFTVEQHLKIYARLKDINKQETKQIIDFLLQSLYMEGETCTKKHEN